MMIRPSAAALTILIPALAHADVPNVVTDIAPVHSLVSMVMEGVGEPHLLLPANTSPHGYAMRPSDARSLQNADVLVWIGPDLTPWLEKAHDTLGPQAVDLRLLDVGNTIVLPPRSVEIAALLQDEDHDHDHDDDHEDDHEDEEEHEEGHDHDHGDAARDPHAWLHPGNARVWLAEVAAKLAAVDPDNAEVYRANADAARAEIDAVETEVAGLLANAVTTEFAVYHDAFQYFEAAFELSASGAMAGSDAEQPSARRAAALRDAIAEGRITCIFSEPQFADRALKSVSGGAEVATLDPLGSAFDEGPTLYPLVLRSIGEAIAGCT